ncbi:hypothetical protein ASG85_25460 [Paenibacillus sp. Soil724D2]|nr:hypothetical protein ASG85_25460 [Paenibacillus sp. Soil724D2]
MPKNAGNINIISKIKTVSIPAWILEYGFQNKNITHRSMHPTDATTPKREKFRFNERPPSKCNYAVAFF